VTRSDPPADPPGARNKKIHPRRSSDSVATEGKWRIRLRLPRDRFLRRTPRPTRPSSPQRISQNAGKGRARCPRHCSTLPRSSQPRRFLLDLHPSHTSHFAGIGRHRYRDLVLRAGIVMTRCRAAQGFRMLALMGSPDSRERQTPDNGTGPTYRQDHRRCAGPPAVRSMAPAMKSRKRRFLT